MPRHKKYYTNNLVIYATRENNKNTIEKVTKQKEKEMINDFDFWVNKARRKFFRIGPHDCNNKMPLQKENFMKIISTAIAYKKNSKDADKIYEHNKNIFIKNLIKNYSRKN